MRSTTPCHRYCKKKVTELQLNYILINPFQPNIRMHILHAVLQTFPNDDNKENLYNNQDL